MRCLWSRFCSSCVTEAGSERCRHSLQITSDPGTLAPFTVLCSRHGVSRADSAHCSSRTCGKQLVHIVERFTLSRRLWHFRCSCLSLFIHQNGLRAIEQVLSNLVACRRPRKIFSEKSSGQGV